jgi:pimeloyl-ACP methyl ester carboxylesterase
MQSMESLAVEHRVYALDLWGFGDSDKTETRFTMEQYAGMLETFIDELGIIEPVIVGHSLGAGVAIDYAGRHAEKVKKVVAVSLPLDPKTIDRRLANFANDSVLSKMFRWKPIPFKEVEQEAARAAVQVIPRSLESFSQMNVIEKMLNLSCSILLVYGEKDDVVDPTPVRELDGGLNHVKYVSLSASRHFPMLDESTKFNRLLKDFADRNATLDTLVLKEEWRRRVR